MTDAAVRAVQFDRRRRAPAMLTERSVGSTDAIRQVE
jgi:hypothetical protein